MQSQRPRECVLFICSSRDRRPVKQDAICPRCWGLLCCFQLNNLVTLIFPQIVIVSVNKLKLSFQTTGPMQMVTKLSSTAGPIAQLCKSVPRTSLPLWAVCSVFSQVCCRTAMSRLVYYFFYFLKGDGPVSWTLSHPECKSLCNLKTPGAERTEAGSENDWNVDHLREPENPELARWLSTDVTWAGRQRPYSLGVWLQGPGSHRFGLAFGPGGVSASEVLAEPADVEAAGAPGGFTLPPRSPSNSPLAWPGRPVSYFLGPLPLPHSLAQAFCLSGTPFLWLWLSLPKSAQTILSRPPDEAGFPATKPVGPCPGPAHCPAALDVGLVMTPLLWATLELGPENRGWLTIAAWQPSTRVGTLSCCVSTSQRTSNT